MEICRSIAPSQYTISWYRPLGGPLDPDALYDVLHETQDAAEVQRLGHADASTTMNIYTHLLTDEGRKYAEKVEEALPLA
jgi:hypothetical protein